MDRWTWGVAFGVALVTFVVLSIFKSVIARRLQEWAAKTPTKIDDVIAGLLGRTKLFFLLGISGWTGSLVLSLCSEWKHRIATVAVIVLVAQGAIWMNGFITIWVEIQKKLKQRDDPGVATSIGIIGFLVRLGLWAVVLLLILDNLGVNITSLVAGLGVGGIAVALAVQNILGDLFASISLLMDKPFVVGDSIVVDDVVGTVESIGLKTTRVRSLTGEEVLFANADLLRSRIRNTRRMTERRAVFTFGVTYQISYEKLAAISEMVRQIVAVQPHVRFDQAHFKEYGDSALVFEVVYYVRSAEYNLFMDTQQAINLALFRRFKEEKIEFAYPTRTLYLQQTGSHV